MSSVDTKTVVHDASYHEKHGIPVVSLDEAMWNIELSLVHGQLRGVIALIAEAGVGKSQMIHQLAKKHKYRVVDIRTAAFSLLAAGVPQRAEGGMFKIAVPEDYPKKGEKCIMFFDEINQGQSHAINMFFKLLEDRGMFDYELDENTLIVCAMNPASSGYQVSKLETLAAFNRRLMKFYITENPSVWLKHAATPAFHGNNPAHPLVLGFIAAQNSMLYDKAAKEKNQQFACPATWQTVSNSLYVVEEYNKKMAEEDKKKPEKERSFVPLALNDNQVKTRVASSIGTIMADHFMTYVTDTSSLIDPLDVLKHYTNEKNDVRSRTKRQIGSSGGRVIELIPAVADALFNNMLKVDKVGPNFCNFWDDLPPELANTLYTALYKSAQSPASTQEKDQRKKYMTELTAWALDNSPEYARVNDRINNAQNEEKRALEGGDDADNPLKKGSKKKK